MTACPVCRSTGGAREFHDGELEVWRCGGCGHRAARHLLAVGTDYYEHTPQDPRFVASLEATRRRQARDILARVERLDGPPRAWLDFGCGRGWFLETARASGVPDACGFESSEVATRMLRARGLAVARPRDDEAGWPDWSTAPTSPRYVSLLDVLEHFEGEGARRVLTRLAAELPELQALVVKVPSSAGVFFRAARALRGSAPGLYRQLFQVGTTPPHEHYFSRRSLLRLLDEAGFRAVAAWGDRDVDDVFHRIPPIAHWPGGRAAAHLARLFPADALVVVARPRR